MKTQGVGRYNIETPVPIIKGAVNVDILYPKPYHCWRAYIVPDEYYIKASNLKIKIF